MKKSRINMTVPWARKSRIPVTIVSVSPGPGFTVTKRSNDAAAVGEDC